MEPKQYGYQLQGVWDGSRKCEYVNVFVCMIPVPLPKCFSFIFEPENHLYAPTLSVIWITIYLLILHRVYPTDKCAIIFK